VVTKSRITINLDENNYRKLIELSNELDVSLAWLGRKAFSDLLAKYRIDEEDGKDSSVVFGPSNNLASGS
tara:strand:- start:2977 stop:3186 length:210 start_codon:yes stop_codon:yes gene_type:complete